MLVLIALAACLLCYLIYLGFQYCMVTGASRELRNAVDASMLNVSKRTVEIKVNPTAAYSDCADSNGTVGLSNVNRVWAKAYLINANVDEMRHERLVTPAAAGAADLAYNMAMGVNEDLRRNINNKIVLDSFFAQMSDKRQAALLSNSPVKHSVGHAYPTSLVDRGAESNITFNHKALPQAASPSGVTHSGTNHLQGYSPFYANEKPFCFTPFRKNETPHLIADSDFLKNRPEVNPLKGFTNAIPNAFQGRGVLGNADSISLSATASAIANPQRQFQMTIPHSYIRIRFQNQSIWMVDDVIVNSIQYLPKPVRTQGIKDFKLKDERFLNGWATLGTEFKESDLYGLLETVPANHDPAVERLLQRCMEIDPGFSTDRVLDLLRRQSTSKTTLSYYIYPIYETPDLTDPFLDIQPQNGDLPHWLDKGAEPEAVEKEVVQEPPVVDRTDPVVLIRPKGDQCPKRREISGQCTWQPGTGMSQCLGTLYVNRLTKVIFEPGTEKNRRGF